MFCSFPFLFSLLCGPVFLFCFSSPFLFPNHSSGQHKLFFFFFFFFNSASRASNRAYSLGKRKIFAFHFFLYSTHHLRVVLSMWSLNVIPQQRYSVEDALGQTMCFALCTAYARQLLCWDVWENLLIPAPSLHSSWSPCCLQISYKGPSYPERPQVEADGGMLCCLHFLHPS